MVFTVVFVIFVSSLLEYCKLPYMQMIKKSSRKVKKLKSRASIDFIDGKEKKAIMSDLLLYSRIFPPLEIVTTCQGMNFPLFFRAVSAAR